jgi:hypothetical protein
MLAAGLSLLEQGESLPAGEEVAADIAGRTIMRSKRPRLSRLLENQNPCPNRRAPT